MTEPRTPLHERGEDATSRYARLPSIVAVLFLVFIVAEAANLFFLLVRETTSYNRWTNIDTSLSTALLIPAVLFWILVTCFVYYSFEKGQERVQEFVTLAVLCLPLLPILPKLFESRGTPALVAQAPKLEDVQIDAPFSCVHGNEHDLLLNPEANQLYQYANWRVLHDDDYDEWHVAPEIERYVRIATAYQHDAASVLLFQMIGKGGIKSEHPGIEQLSLAEELLKRGSPEGYYRIGEFLPDDYDLRERYRRKAADLGGADAQYQLGTWLTENSDEAVQGIGVQMLRCALEQGYTAAQTKIANRLQKSKKYPEAMQAFQLGIVLGEYSSAQFLARAFDGTGQNDENWNLGQPIDKARADRYGSIMKFMFEQSEAKFPDVDAIVPLPPAKLPTWDGKFMWEKFGKAKLPPALPSEERIVEMARAKNLDPETGRALSPRNTGEAKPENDKPSASASAAPLALTSGSRNL